MGNIVCDNSIIVKYDKPKQCRNNGKCTYRVYEQQYRSNGKLCFSNYSYNKDAVYTKKPQDPLDGFELEDVLDYIKETNILQYVFRVLDKNTTNSIKKIRELLKDDTKFVCSPILKDKHWVVAVISKDEINIFDPTLQTKEALDVNGQLQIGDCKQKVHYLNKKPIQDKNGTICGLCSAEFIIWASKCESLEHLRQNMDIICDNVATNVIRVIGQENAKNQLTEDFQNGEERQLLRLELALAKINDAFQLPEELGNSVRSFGN